MKNWKRWVLTCAAAAAVVSLTACGKIRQDKQEIQQEKQDGSASITEIEKIKRSPEEAIAAAAMHLASVESLDASITVDLGIKVLGQKFDAKALMDMTTFQSPMKMKADLSLDLGILGTNKMQIYAREQDEKYGLYLYSGGKWTKQEVQSMDLKKYNGQKIMNIYLDKIGDLKEDGTEELDSGSADKYSGVIHGDTLTEVFQNSGISDSMNALMANDVLKPLGALMQNHEEMIREIFENAEDIPVSIWIDSETDYPVQCSMDITDIVSRIFDEINKNTTDKVSTANILSEIDISGTNITVECSNFNSSEDFTIPAEALKGNGGRIF